MQPRFVLPVVKERVIPLRLYVVCDGKGNMAVDLDTVADQVGEANRIFRQVGIAFCQDEPFRLLHLPQCFDLVRDAQVTNDAGKVVSYVPSPDVRGLFSLTNNYSYVLVWVNRIVSAGNAAASTYGSRRIGIISSVASPQAFAHEIGHLLGLTDIYDRYKRNQTILMPQSNVSVSSWFFGDQVHDWAAGDASGFYRSADTGSPMQKSMLMYGIDVGSGMDIPSGFLRGFPPYPRNIFDYDGFRSVGADSLRQEVER